MKKWILILAMAFTACSEKSSESPAASDGTQAIVPPKVYKHFAYVGAQYTNLIHQFAIDAVTGVVAPLLTTPSIAAQNLPMITAASFDGKTLVAINYSSNSVSSYQIAKSGELSLVEHQALDAGSAPGWVSAHPKLPIFYTADSGLAQISILDVDSAGQVSVRGHVAGGAGVTCLVLNKAGTFLYSVDQNADRLSVYAIAADGGLTLLTSASLPAGSSPNQATLSADERFVYVANWGTQSVAGFSVQGNNLVSIGAPTASGTGGVYTVTVSPDGKRLFAAKPYGNNFSEHAIDPATGAIGTAVTTAANGSVGFTFWKDFVYHIKWNSAVIGLPIDTYRYSENAGMGATPASSTLDGYRGIYRMTIVSVLQD